MFKIRSLITCKEVFQQQNRFYAKEVRFGNEVKRLLLQGVDTIADAVSITLGPKGRNVIYEEKNKPVVTKDGVTVARTIDLEDRWKNMGVKVIQSVAKNTNRRAGDGTTTATVLARTIAKEGFEKMIHGSNPNEIRKGMMMALDVALRNLDRISKPVVSHEDIKNVATISSNGDAAIGRLIAEALQKVGKEGNVTVKEGKTFKDSFEILNGIRIENGYVSPSFINARGNKCILKDSLILFCDMKLTNIRPILHALDVAALKRKPVVIVAEDFEEEVIVAMILNKLRGGSKVAAVKSPGSGDYRKEILYDMAAATGGRVYGDESLDEKSDVIDNSFFGRAEEIILTKDETLFLKCKGKKDAIDERADIIRGLIEQMNNDFDRKKYQERLARLLSGVAVINIGAGSETELKEKKDRVEDAVHATRAAIEEGIVPGGGVALVRCIEEINKVYTENDDQKAGVEVLAKALKTPCMVIADNAGADSSLVFHKILEAKNDFGYDARNNVYVHMLQAGIIDPTKVVKTALGDAAAAASLLTTTEAAVTFVFDGDEIPL